LLAFGSGPVRGFAVVHVIGILTSMFSAVFFARGLVNVWYGGKRKLKSLAIGQVWRPSGAVRRNDNEDDGDEGEDNTGVGGTAKPRLPASRTAARPGAGKPVKGTATGTAAGTPTAGDTSGTAQGTTASKPAAKPAAKPPAKPAAKPRSTR